jgi:hypothetical protein
MKKPRTCSEGEDADAYTDSKYLHTNAKLLPMLASNCSERLVGCHLGPERLANLGALSRFTAISVALAPSEGLG